MKYYGWFFIATVGLGLNACSGCGSNDIGGPGTTTSTIAKIEGEVLNSSGASASLSKIQLFEKQEKDIVQIRVSETNNEGVFMFDSLEEKEYLVYIGNETEGASTDLLTPLPNTQGSKLQINMRVMKKIKIRSSEHIVRFYGINLVELEEDSLGYFQTNIQVEGKSSYWLELEKNSLSKYTAELIEDSIQFKPDFEEGSVYTFELGGASDNENSVKDSLESGLDSLKTETNEFQDQS
jgi:hypothetical protein